MGHLNKPSKELIVDLINEAGQELFLSTENLDFETPVPSGVPARNTNIVAVGVMSSGFRGRRTLRYTRLDMGTAMPPTEGGATELMVPNDGPESKLDIIPRLNQMFSLKLAAEDIVDGPVDSTVLPVTVNIAANPASLAWIGTVKIELTPDRPLYKDTFSSFALDGLPVPGTGGAGLDAPTVATNQSPSFLSSGNLYQPGNGAYPATNFVVSTNSEIEVAASPRVGNGDVAVAPDSSGYNYNLALAGANDWKVMIALGSKETPAVDFLLKYRVWLGVTGPDGTEATFEILRDETSIALVGMGLPARRTLSEISPGLVQGPISVGDISSVLGTVLRNGAGAPLGQYKFRVFARRTNTVVPRVLTSFAVGVIN